MKYIKTYNESSGNEYYHTLSENEYDEIHRSDIKFDKREIDQLESYLRKSKLLSYRFFDDYNKFVIYKYPGKNLRKGVFNDYIIQKLPDEYYLVYAHKEWCKWVGGVKKCEHYSERWKCDQIDGVIHLFKNEGI